MKSLFVPRRGVCVARGQLARTGLAAAGLAMLVAGCSESEPSEMPELTTVEVEEPEPVPTCETPPANGAVLTRDEAKGAGPHTVSIDNTSAGNTIVNVRDGATNDLVLSFFVAEGQEAGVSDIPDGSYRIQYATGRELDEECKNFAVLGGASQDPEIVEFPAGSAMTLTYTLTPMVGGVSAGTMNTSSIAGGVGLAAATARPRACR